MTAGLEHHFPANSFAFCPNIFLRASSSNGSFTNLPIARPACTCGRARPILEQIDGRIEDYLVTPDGRRIGRMDHIFKDTLEIKEAQIYQPSVERILVRIVPRSGFDKEAQRALEREFRRRIGYDVEIHYQVVDAIPRLPSGKFRAVISEVGRIGGGR